MLDAVSCNWVVESVVLLKLSSSESKLIGILESLVNGNNHLLSSDRSKEIADKWPDLLLVLSDVGGDSVPSPENFEVSVIVEIVGLVDKFHGIIDESV